MSAGRRALSMIFLSAGVILMTAGMAFGQGVTGGCTATVNDRAPSTMTEDNPLVIEKGGTVVVEGNVPPSVAGLPRDEIQSTTVIKIEVVKGVLGPTIETRQGKGPSWGGTAEVPKILNDLAPGVYKVTGEATGTPGWSCEGSGYIDLKGGPASAAAAAGAILAAGGGGMALGGKGPSLSESSQISPKKVSGKWKGILKGIKELIPELKATWGADAAAALAYIILCLLFWGIL